ncbi:VanZ family protein [Oscillospiraceae bacterium HV4-5-C5C]|nr:VanZ family protein [Oscillospiraceae bacterium HV4-5-C5C]
MDMINRLIHAFLLLQPGFKTWLFLSLAPAAAAGVFSLVRGKKIRRSLALAAFIFYVCIAFLLTVFPLPQGKGSSTVADVLASIDHRLFTPLIYSFRLSLSELAQGRQHALLLFLYNNLGNFILLMPEALFLCLLFDFSSLKAFVLCLLTSLGIESFQLLANLYFRQNYRVVDINDVLLNTAGAAAVLLPLALIRLVKRRSKAARQRRRQTKGA